MSDRVIARADLTEIERALGSVDVRLTVLGSSQQQIAAELLDLRSDFAAFVAEDARQKQLQLAETRLVKVRQEIEERSASTARCGAAPPASCRRWMPGSSRTSRCRTPPRR